MTPELLATYRLQLGPSFGFAAAPRERRAKADARRRPDASPLADALVDMLAGWFADNRATLDSFKLDAGDPGVVGLTGFGRDHAGADVRHAVAVARGPVSAADLDAAVVKAALAKGLSERRTGR